MTVSLYDNQKSETVINKVKLSDFEFDLYNTEREREREREVVSLCSEKIIVHQIYII